MPVAAATVAPAGVSGLLVKGVPVVSTDARGRPLGLGLRAYVARIAADGTETFEWRAPDPPDAIDTAWLALQRRQADEDTLLLLGVFDA